MPFTLTVDMPNLGSQEIYIHGLGSFSNGKHKISDAQAEQFSLINSKAGYGPADEDGSMKIVAIPGPKLTDAVAAMYCVTIEEDNTDSTSDTQAETYTKAEQVTTPSGTEEE